MRTAAGRGRSLQPRVMAAQTAPGEGGMAPPANSRAVLHLGTAAGSGQELGEAGRCTVVPSYSAALSPGRHTGRAIGRERGRQEGREGVLKDTLFP